jgi:regulatory protein
VNERPEEVEVIGWDEDPQAGRLTITTSDGATYEVAPSAPEIAALAIGVRLDLEALDGLGQAAARKATAKEALRLLDRRFYSRSRLRLRLLQKDLDPAAVEAVLDQLMEQGLLDDVRFAEAWSRDQLRRKPVGRLYLRSGLRDQGVAEAAIESALEVCLPPEEEAACCRRALFSRRYAMDSEKNRMRALRFLMSRGFSQGLARESVFQARDEQKGEG